MLPTRRSSYAALAWIWALPSLALALLIAFLLGPVLVRSPDAGRIGALFLASTIDDCRPEPVEHVRYVLFIALAPFIYVVGLLVARRGPVPMGAPLARFTLASQWALLVGALAVWAYSRLNVAQHFREFPFVVVLSLVLVFRRRGIEFFETHARDHWGWVLAAFGFFALKFLPTILTPGGLHLTLRHVSYHLSFTLNEFAAVQGGLSPFVDFHPQYQNVMPLLLAPVFRWTGIGVTSFSVVMLALSFATIFFVFAIFRRVTGDRRLTFALIVPFIAMSTVPFIHTSDMHANAFTYYAVGPLRYFVPFLSAFLCSNILRRERRFAGARYFGVFTVATIGAINNLDFGIPSFVAVGAALGIAQRRWGRLLVTGALGVATGIGIVAALVRASSGHWPDWSQMGEYQRIFALYGYFMIPSPEVGLYWIVIATFLAALAVALVRRLGGGAPDSVEHRHMDGMLVYSAVFGCGAMMYYIGRSHTQVLIAMFPAWAFSFLLLLGRQGLGHVLSRWRLVSDFERIPLVLTGMLYVVMLTTVTKFPSPIAQVSRILTRQGAFERRFAEQVSALVELSKPGEAIMVTAPFGHWLALEAGRKNVFPYAEAESLLLKQQVREVGRTIEARHVNRLFGRVSNELRTALLGLGFRPGVAHGELEVWSR